MKKIGLFLIFLALLILLFIPRKPTSRAGLEFYASPCNMSISPYNKTNLGIKEIKWLNETTLQVKAYISINCAEDIQGGDYEIEGNQITLKYISPKCKEVCAECMCAHELVFKLFNLEKKDYKFELKRIQE